MSDPTDPDDGLSETPVLDAGTGESKGTVLGLEEFRAGWKHNVELPHQLRFDAWQMCDEVHPADGGKSAYRLVHKTIRTIPIPSVSIDLQTLLLRVENGQITVGEPVFHGSLPSRREGTFLIPEWGTVETDSDGATSYRYSDSHNIRIQGRQETLPPGNYVEILCQLPVDVGTSYAEQLAAGRAMVAPLTAVLDLLFGERLLGPILTEEVGAVFEDWHWNRKLGGRSVATESQARQEHLDGRMFVERVGPAIDLLLQFNDEQRQRVRVASQWYWRAESEADNVIRFVGYWLVLEALELGEKANIGPLKSNIAKLLTVEKSAVTEQVGRLYGLRNKLLHGKQRVVTNEDVERVRALAVALLESHTLGKVSSGRLAALHDALSPSSG